MPLSEKTFITMMVLERDKAMPIYAETVELNPRIIEAFPISLTTFGFKCNPTVNKRNAIPIFEKVPIIFSENPYLTKKGLTIIPAMMYPIIIGCFSSLTKYEMTNATDKIIA